MRGVVTSVYDGDTVTLKTQARGQIKIRLLGIDAPEVEQRYGTTARDALRRKVLGRDVVMTGDKKDRYGRSLGILWLDNTNVNLWQIESGNAWFYRDFQRDLPTDLRPLMDQGEQEARRERRGLWSGRAVPPWEWRKVCSDKKPFWSRWQARLQQKC